MATLFSDDWKADFGNARNGEKELGDALAKIGFNSVIAYGFDNEDQLRGSIKVENGCVVEAGAFSGQTLNRDLRASPPNWEEWRASSIGMMGLGLRLCFGRDQVQAWRHLRQAQDSRHGRFLHRELRTDGKGSAWLKQDRPKALHRPSTRRRRPEGWRARPRWPAASAGGHRYFSFSCWRVPAER
ncbi:hypothetical protein [Rhodoblastus sp.]|uniref:hypothetical protein n=1 Tax=Rhodoblastus sp. TaxID=1962975 RepID=UPI003F9B9232